MKKIISAMAIALACFSTWATTPQAQPQTQPQIVKFIWPWAVGTGGASTMMRHLIQSANQQQDKYQFVFTQKAGAGGSVGANYALSSNTLVVLGHADAMYTRPMLYHEAQDVTQFRLISVICSNTPLALFSRKYTSIDQLKNKDVTVGVNPGTATQLFINLITANNPEFKFTIVPYKGLSESAADLLGGHIDTTVSYLGSTSAALTASNVPALGVSGNRSFPGVASLSSLKVKGVDQLVNSYYIFVPRSVNVGLAQEFNKIFNNAANSELFKEACVSERGTVESVAFDQTEKMHQSNIQKWQKLTQGIPKQ